MNTNRNKWRIYLGVSKDEENSIEIIAKTIAQLGDKNLAADNVEIALNDDILCIEEIISVK